MELPKRDNVLNYKAMEKLVELVNLWASYSRENPDIDIKDFCVRYLAEQHIPAFQPKEEINQESDANQDDFWSTQSLLDGELSALVGRLSRFAYFYSKKAVEKMRFKNLDDIIYLFLMIEMKSPKKSELIYAMLSEFASGIDIINRLLKMGLCEEFPDENDKRAKRVRITPTGIEALQEASPIMAQISRIAFNELTQTEKKMITHILRRADRFHSEHYADFRGQDFDSIYESVINPES